MPFGTLAGFYFLWLKECCQVLWFAVLELWCFLFLSILDAEFWRTVGSLDSPLPHCPEFQISKPCEYLSTFLSPLLFILGLYWTNFVACVTVPVISPILVCCSMLIPQDMNQSEALFSICRSLTKFLQPERTLKKIIHIFSLRSFYFTERNGWRGHRLSLGPWILVL
jgi:hypothetical protein